MASLAIKGNNVRCKEVIEILEMLGGENKYGLTGDESNAYYVIENNDIKCGIYIFGDEPYVFLTVEEFKNKYPYKIGDRVSIPEYESEVRICKMHWDGYEVQYMVYRCDEEEYYSAKELNEYNDINDVTTEDNNLYDKLDFTQEPSADKVELILGDYEIVEENGKTYLVKKKIYYPKTYDECCDVLGISKYACYCVGYKEDLLDKLQKLIVCRDAYWHLYSNWKPNWGTLKYCITNMKGSLNPSETSIYFNHILSFPTEEMRDKFYETFNDLIEKCKMFL